MTNRIICHLGVLALSLAFGLLLASASPGIWFYKVRFAPAVILFLAGFERVERTYREQEAVRLMLKYGRKVDAGPTQPVQPFDAEQFQMWTSELRSFLERDQSELKLSDFPEHRLVQAFNAGQSPEEFLYPRRRTQVGPPS